MNLRVLRERAGLIIRNVVRDLYQCTEEELVQAVKESMLSEHKQA